MPNALKILLLEDSPADAEIIHNLLLKEMASFNFKLATGEKEFLTALDEFIPEVILSDNSLPQFNATEALKIVRRRCLHIPFILITGTVSEEYAATVIKMGADDYILKDRLTRLPSAIDAALRQRKTEKDKRDAWERLRTSEEKYRTLVEQAFDGIFIYSPGGAILECNATACDYLGYTKKELKQLTVAQLFFEEDLKSDPLYFETLKTGHLTLDSRKLKRKDGTYLEMEISAKIMPDRNMMATARDITEKKKAEEAMKQLQEDLLQQQKAEQVKIIATALEAQEKERHDIGMELHDNVNQILVGTNLLLSMVKTSPDKREELIATSIKQLKEAIEENRKIAHVFVVPDFERESLVDLLKKLIHTMLHPPGIQTKVLTAHFNENLLSNEQKINIYRIAQEQCTNIVKYAGAKNVVITLSTNSNFFKMAIEDDGSGMDLNIKTSGIGLKNINGRLSIFNGHSEIITSPGKGFMLEITIPC